jgi:S-methylmethionine-dependent homocysteine/selenocysteine methylase
MLQLKDWLLSSESSSSSSLPRPTTTTTTTTTTILLMDGGVSTHLEQLLEQLNRKFPIRELWSSSLLLSQEGRDTILQGHKNWLCAGSDILTTVTYQCHYGVKGVESVVDDDQMTKLIEWGVQLGKQAVEEERNNNKSQQQQQQQQQALFVVGSSGCYGAALADGSEYTGNYGSVDRIGLEDFHRRKIETFLKMGLLNGLAIETIPCVRECEAVCNVLSTLSSSSSSSSSTINNDVACWISLACRDGVSLNEGAPILTALDIIRQKDPTAQYVHAIGINCCDSAHISALVETITHDMATKGPRRGIVIYPNSGEEWDAEHESWKEGTGCTDSDQFAERLQQAVQIVRDTWGEHHNDDEGGGTMPPPRLILGGCC